MQVLVIEDNEVNLVLMESILRHNGCTVISATTGEQGAQLAVDTKPHLVFLDIGLPDMDGFEVARRIRASLGDSLPIIVVSAHAFEEYRLKAEEAKCQHFVTKPLSLPVVERLVRERRMTLGELPT